MSRNRCKKETVSSCTQMVSDCPFFRLDAYPDGDTDDCHWWECYDKCTNPTAIAAAEKAETQPTCAHGEPEALYDKCAAADFELFAAIAATEKEGEIKALMETKQPSVVLTVPPDKQCRCPVITGDCILGECDGKEDK